MRCVFLSTQVLEQVNGTLASQYPDSTQYRGPDGSDTSTAPAAPSASSSDCPFWLVKFDMAESRCVLQLFPLLRGVWCVCVRFHAYSHPLSSPRSAGSL